MVGEGNIMCGMELCTQGTVMAVHKRLCVCVCVWVHTRSPDVCAPLRVHTCTHIKLFPPRSLSKYHVQRLQFVPVGLIVLLCSHG